MLGNSFSFRQQVTDKIPLSGVRNNDASREVSLLDPYGKPWVATIPDTHPSATTQELRCAYRKQFASFFDRDPLLHPVFRLTEVGEELKENDNLSMHRSPNGSQLHLFSEIHRSFPDMSPPILKVRYHEGKLMAQVLENDAIYAVLHPNQKDWTKYHRDDRNGKPLDPATMRDEFRTMKHLDPTRTLNEASHKHHSGDAIKSRLKQKLKFGNKKNETCIVAQDSYIEESEEVGTLADAKESDNNPLDDDELIRLFEPAKRAKKKRKQKKTEPAVASPRDMKSNTTTGDTPASDSVLTDGGESTASEQRTGKVERQHVRSTLDPKKPDVSPATTHIASEDDGEWQQCTKSKKDKEKKEKKEPVVSVPLSTTPSAPRCLPGTFSTNARPDLERTKLCRRFATNQTCMFAENCWFSHDIRLLEIEREERIEELEPIAEKKEETVPPREKPSEGTPTPLTRAPVVVKSAERPDPPAKQLATTVWGTLAPVAKAAKAHPSSKAISPTVEPPATRQNLAPSRQNLAPPPAAPTIVHSKPVVRPVAEQKGKVEVDTVGEKSLPENSFSPGMQFLQREQCREISFLQRWGLPVEQGIEILAFATEKQKAMAYSHFNPSHDDITIEALVRFLDTSLLDTSDCIDSVLEPCIAETEDKQCRVPPSQCPPPPPKPTVAPIHATADDQGWEDLFRMPFSAFPSKALVPPHVSAGQVLCTERIVTEAYDGIEISEKGVSEGGYLSLNVGDVVVPTDGDFPGHARNRFPSYFFGYIAKDGHKLTGWFPAVVFH